MTAKIPSGCGGRAIPCSTLCTYRISSSSARGGSSGASFKSLSFELLSFEGNLPLVHDTLVLFIYIVFMVHGLNTFLSNSRKYSEKEILGHILEEERLPKELDTPL
jgi:hypothetical protein